MRLMDLFTNYVTFSSEIFLPFVGKGILGGVLGDVDGVGLGVGILKNWGFNWFVVAPCNMIVRQIDFTMVGNLFECCLKCNIRLLYRCLVSE